MATPRPVFTISGRVGYILLAIWLILTGAISLFHLSMEALPIIMGLLAILAGMFILVGW